MVGVVGSNPIAPTTFLLVASLVAGLLVSLKQQCKKAASTSFKRPGPDRLRGPYARLPASLKSAARPHWTVPWDKTQFSLLGIYLNVSALVFFYNYNYIHYAMT